MDVSHISAPSITKIEWLCTICNTPWSATVDSVLNLGSGCPKCAGNKKMTLEECQERIESENRNIIVLSLANGRKNHERRGKLRCGSCSHEWEMILSNLLGKKQGCPRCGKSGRYTESWFHVNKDREKVLGRIYLIRLHNEEEEFLKVGITKRDIKSRFTTSVPYLKETLVDVTMPLVDAYYIERIVLDQFGKYTPQKHFGGKNECFHVNHEKEIRGIIERYETETIEE